MKLVFISGPYKADTNWQIERNIRNAEIASLMVWKLGAVPICVHTMNRHFFGEIDEERVINGCMDIIMRCDAILMLSGWEESAGSYMEYNFAMKNNVTVFTRIDELANWLEGKK
ncbi:MAG TPA: DUF4406 domain-containing protein [Thermotogaceae bacterium]|nr:DUF4406 domain-containing protein [Thermotogaceae bacterium]